MNTKHQSNNSLEQYFSIFRKNIIGYNQTFNTPFGEKKMIYADWTASGRMYAPIEKKIVHEFAPFIGNTHTVNSTTGKSMTLAYSFAKGIIKKHINARDTDVVLISGSGMTSVVNKFQRILGLRIPERFKKQIVIPENEKPVVFVTHKEHHSNHISWLETIADVEIIHPTEEGLVDLRCMGSFEYLLEKYKNRKTKIAAITACSNVTGIQTPYHAIAKRMHQNGGLCFVDFACSAPYTKINMHPDNPLERLDAVYFSPHKFLGGPGTSGVLVFDPCLHENYVPDEPGGGTVSWTNPWGEHQYIADIESREDGGTPAFMQTIKTALCIKLKEEMGITNMLLREKEIVQLLFKELKKIQGLHILAENIEDRLAVISFYIDELHYNLGVKLLNDYFGIQSRDGCDCAGTYGHYLLHIDKKTSKEITDRIDRDDLSTKPGWLRISIHPVMTDDEVLYICNAINELANNFKSWQKDYVYDSRENTFTHKQGAEFEKLMVTEWFNPLQHEKEDCLFEKGWGI